MTGIHTPWRGYIKPFRVWGNLYFVGTQPASTHIIDTEDGLIMLDSGYQHSLYLLLHNMYRLGLDPMQVKYIVHTHGHIDHCGATAALVHLTGAKTFIGQQDADYVNGTLPLSWAAELGLELEPFEADVLLHDGDKIRLGSTEITAVATPGHTPGSMSLLFDVQHNGRTLRAALHGGAGSNTMKRDYLLANGLPLSLRTDFLAAMDKLASIPVDIFLGNHMEHNETPRRYENLIRGDLDAFVDPTAWAAFAQERKAFIKALLEEEALGQ